MPKKMLIDASHPEETRVVIVEGNRVEDFDFESLSIKPLKGNIYLAKVTRVEPSLQACFVEYGGNRHGFLAFSEIHPDYYQIPVADRQALLAAQREDERSAEVDEERGARRGSRRRRGGPENHAEAAPHAEAAELLAASPQAEADTPSSLEEGAAFEASEFLDLPDAVMPENGSTVASEPPAPTMAIEVDEDAAQSLASESYAPDDSGSIAAPWPMDDLQEDSQENGPVSTLPDLQEPLSEPGIEGNVQEINPPPDEIESVGGEDDEEDDFEEKPARRQPRNIRPYKIQEVIKRRQVMLVQVVKEERGSKGAALTTYLSLAGRYCVLMPNTPRGGGISRKITNQSDRKRLKEIVSDFEVPEGMGVIVRTAGAARTRPEIRRDYEYLLRLWENIRSATMRSAAPSLIYEEGNIVKRAIRDNLSKDIDSVLVEGAAGYSEARDFMRMLLPAQVDTIQLYQERTPLFQAYRVETQLDSMFNPRVQLRSGGYIVINVTEALVSIDVNSGKATREHNIEDTALKTNLEASEEIARQLRLRDMAGLIVIDFIDMEENRNNRAVEKRLKDCLRHDRARIQVGRISPFGLLEMSRQRLRPGILEGSTVPCPHCAGTGIIRSVESMALRVLRQIDEEGHKGRERHLTVRVPMEVAIYLLNQKRFELSQVEARWSLSVYIETKTNMIGADTEIVPGVPENYRPRRVAIEAMIGPQTGLEAPLDAALEEAEEDDLEEVEVVDDAERAEEMREEGDDAREPRRRRRRRRRGRGRGEEGRGEEGRGEEGRGEEGRGEEVRSDEAHEAPLSAEGATAGEGLDTQAGALPENEFGGDRTRFADTDDADGEAGDEDDAAGGASLAGDDEGANGGRRRRRGRRGGRRHRRGEGGPLPAPRDPFTGPGDGDGSPAPEMAELAPGFDEPLPADRAVAAAGVEPPVSAGAAVTLLEPVTLSETLAVAATRETPQDEALMPVIEPAKPEPAAPPAEPVKERPTIASYFGFGAKPAAPVEAGSPPQAEDEARPARRGWWQKKD
ncbi:MAG: Rne/Rng family ribonuclease [Alphaproteobacteria bacterium]|nr:Rne/Rng family ribonuclease [Alphaproteobacteria bacterium]